MDAIKHAQVGQIGQAMERSWGKPALQPLRSLQPQQVVSTGYSELDHALGIGGLPAKNLIVLHGHPDSGITTLAYHLIAAFQRVEKFVIYLDITQTFDPEYAVKKCDIKPKNFQWIYPDDLADALTLTRDIVVLPYDGLIVIDAALLERDDSHALSSHLEQLKLPLKSSTWACFLLLSPQFMDVGKFYAAIQIITQQIRWIEEAGDMLGYVASARVIKNVLHPRLGQATFSVLVGGL